MLPSRKVFVLPLVAFSLILDLSFSSQRRVGASARTNFALHEDIEATSTCGIHGSESFCSFANQTKCEACNITCPFGQTPLEFVNLLTEGYINEIGLVNSSCLNGVVANDSAAVMFTTATGYVSADASRSDGWTVSTWIKQKAGNKGYIFTKTDNNTFLLLLLADDSVHELSLTYQNTTTNVTTTLIRAVNISLSNSGCHHVAVTCYESVVHVFVDGEFLGGGFSDVNFDFSGVLFLGGGHNFNASFLFEGEMTSPRLYHEALLPSEIAKLSGKAARKPRIRPECRCPQDYPSVSSEDEHSCVNLESNRTVQRLNNKSHFPAHGNDGDGRTWWQSNNGVVPVNISVSLGGVKQVLLVEMLFKSPPPKGMVLLKSTDNGITWTPFQYFAQNCQDIFHMKSLGQLGQLDKAGVVNCDDRFSNPVAGQTVKFYLLEDSRPGSKDFEGNSALQKWSLATHLRLHVTLFHGNVSKKTAFVAVSEISVFGRECECPISKNTSSCSCNGTVIRPDCIRRVLFNSDFYERCVTFEAPQAAHLLQVHAQSSCSDSSDIRYSIIGGNTNYTFGLDNITGVMKVLSPLSNNSTYNLLVLAVDGDSEPSVNASVSVIIRISHIKDLNDYTKIDFQVQGLGFIQGVPKVNQDTFGFFVNNHLGFEGRLIASVGSVSTKVIFNVSSAPAVRVKALLVSNEVWHDRPAVHVLAQVQDHAHSVRTLVEQSRVVVRVTPSTELANLNCGNKLQVIATPSPTTGVCAVEILLPSCWFAGTSLTGPQQITVSYGLLSNSNPSLKSLGNVTVHPESKVQLHEDDVYAFLPSRPIDRGATFRFHVYVDSSFAIASYGLKLSTSPCLEIVGVDVHRDTWLHVAANHSSSLWAVSGTLSNPETAPMGLVKRGKLISFDVKINEIATEGRNSTLQLEVTYLSNINNEEVQIGGEPLPYSAAMIDGFNDARDTVGTIRIRLNYVQALLPFVEPSELVNTAVLDGKEVSTKITLLAVRASGTKSVLQSATCLSHSTAVHVENDCSKVWVDGSEPEGSAQAVIQVRHENLTANVSLRVWHPVLPLKLSAEDQELGEVSGWMLPGGMQGGCVQKYQWTKIQARVNVSFDGLHLVEISATDLVSTLLRSSHDSLAYATDDGEIFGKSPGRVTVKALNPATNNVIGSVDVTVGIHRRVSVRSLDIAMVTNMSVRVAPPPYGRHSTQTATVVVGQDMNRDLSRSSVVVYATFSDGTRQELKQNHGLRLTSLDSRVLQLVVNKSEVLTVGSGSGGLKAEWYLLESACYTKGFLLGVGYHMIKVVLSPPVRVDIRNVSPQITVVGDSSTAAGIPTSSRIGISLLFQSGLFTDMTADTRTILDVSESDGFFYVRRDAQNRPIIYGNSAGTFGKKILIIRFTHFDITCSVEVNVVGYVAMALHFKPFPQYPGSDHVFIATLNPIEGTSKYEMASLSLHMVMSDESDYDVTYHSMTEFSSGSNNLIVGEKASNHVRVKTTASPGNRYYVEGYFGDLHESHYVEIGSNTVLVTAIRELSLTPGYNLTLSGVQNTHAAQVKVSLIFDNQKQVPDFYQSGEALFHGLISVTSENEQVFSVDSNTGQVTLRRNYYRKLVLTVTAAVSMVTTQIKVACNLNPGVLDIDLGAESGVPLAPQLVGKSFEVPVRLNAGVGTSKMDLLLVYDRRYLIATSVRGNNVWSNFVKNLNAGEIIINGVCNLGPLEGTQEVAVISFNATAPGLSSIVGSLTTDQATDVQIVAGMLQQVVVGDESRHRRDARLEDDSFSDVHTRRRRRSSPCSTLPPKCNKCDGVQHIGDLDGDCIFDISDVLFILNHYTLSLLNISNPDVADEATLSRSARLDVDRNAMVNPADAYFLVRVQLDLVRFIVTTTVVPVQDAISDCKLSLNVTMATKDGPADPANTYVFFDVTYRGNPVEFSGSTASPRGSDIYGFVIRANSDGGGVYSVSSSIELMQDTIGVSIYQFTTSTDNGTSVIRSSALFGSTVPPYVFPIKLSVEVQVLQKRVSVESSVYNPFIVFNNTLSSSACKNHFEPVFKKAVYSVDISENVADNTTVVFVNATAQDTGKSGEIGYSLVLHEDVPFNIEPGTGRIYTNGIIDREQRDFYNLTVRATDRALGRARYAHVHVAVVVTDVNDNPPVIMDVIPNHVVEVPENAGIGSVLARVVSSDADLDKNSEMLFKLSSPTYLFQINSTSGELTLNGSLHLRVEQSFILPVVVLDKGVPALNSSTSIVIRVTYAFDVDVLFPMPIYRGNVSENSPLNTTVLQVAAYVPGLPEAVVRYFINYNTTFTIGAFDGILRVNVNIDREHSAYFNFTVHALYGDNITSKETLICIEVTDVNDVRPSFERSVYTLELDEGSYHGFVLYKFLAIDLDKGSNAELTFSILSGNESIFRINRTSGEVCVHSLVDYESVQQLNFTVQVRDNGMPSLDANVSIIVDIRDINDNSPVLEPVSNISIREDISIGSDIVTINARDFDSGMNAKLAFSITSGNTGNVFFINSTTGVIKTAATLDYEENKRFALEISVRDHGSPSLTSTTVVRVQLIDVNDVIPVIRSLSRVYVRENVPVGTVIVRLNASDEDSGSNALLKFNISEGNEDGHFALNSTSGIITLSGLLDHENVSEHTLTVNVSDSGSPPLSSTAVVRIYVVDVNDHRPIFKREFYEAWVYENISVGSTFLCVSAFDLDSSSEEGILFSIAAGNINDTFTLNASTGKVKIVRSPDYEHIQLYHLLIEARDTFLVNESVNTVGSENDNQSSVSFSSYTNLTVFILDVNDNAPDFSTSEHVVVINENLSPGVSILRVHALDRDTSENGAVLYSLNPNDGFGLFAINESSGEITIRSSLRDVNYLNYSLQLQATDQGFPPLDGTAKLQVRIWYNVTFYKDRTDLFRFSFEGVFAFGQPVVHSRESVQLDLGLLYQTRGSLVTRVGKLQQVKRFTVGRQAATSARVILLSNWPDYDIVRVAVQVFDNFFDPNTSTDKVHFELRSLSTNEKVRFSCIPSALSGICVADASVPEHWLNQTSVNDTVVISYGVSSSNVSMLSSFPLARPRQPEVKQNFFISAPVYLLNVGYTFVLQGYAQFKEPIASYVLLCRISVGLNVVNVSGTEGWTVYLASNGPAEFAIFGSRNNLNELAYGRAATALYFTLTMNVTDVSFETHEEFRCFVKYVGSVGGSTVISKEVRGTQLALMLDNGRMAIVKDEVKALFVYPDRSVLVNTAVLNGKQIEVALHVLQVSVLGRVINARNPTCHSMALDVLKVSGNCSKVFLDGTETSGSQNAVIFIKKDNVTANVSFSVWLPIIPLRLSVSLRQLNKVKNWFDPSHSCRPRYQNSHVRAFANLTNGNLVKHDVDVTHLTLQGLRSHNSSIAEVVGDTIEGRSQGETTVDVYVPELRKVLGETFILVTGHEVRVYVVDTFVATRLSVSLPPLLSRNASYLANVQAAERFLSPAEEASVVISLQYSDGEVNTFHNLDGFHVYTSNNSLINVQSGKLAPIKSGNGKHLVVTVHSGHCTNEDVGFGLGTVDISFAEPIDIAIVVSSKFLTSPGDPAETLDIPLFAFVNVFLLYNISGEIKRFDVSNDTSTVVNITKGNELVDLSVNAEGILIKTSASEAGNVHVTIGNVHAKLTTTIIMDVLKAQELKILSTPYPSFHNSASINITRLHPIGTSGGHQKVLLKLLLVLSNGSVVDVSRDNNASISICSAQPPELAENVHIRRHRNEEYVLQVTQFSDGGNLNICGMFASMLSQRLSLKIETSSLTVAAVRIILPSTNFTLKGLRAKATQRLSVNVKFSDGTMLLRLFSKENESLWNLITFNTEATDVVSLNSTTGILTLKNNSFQEVTVTASAVDSSVTHSTRITCNLHPDVGDVDIGDVIGVPMKPRSIGETFIATLRINPGTATLGCFDVELNFQPKLLEIIKVEKGPDMMGLMSSNIMANSGKVKIAGALYIANGKKSPLHLATIRFKATSSGIAHLTGRIHMMAEDNVQGTPIGAGSLPRDIVAGNVKIEITEQEGRFRRYVVKRNAPSSRVRRSSGTNCSTPPCSFCPSGREQGDADGNCIFDVRDVKFILTYVAEKQFNFSRPKGQSIQRTILPMQLQELDADGDGVVSVNDADRLLKGRLNLISLFPTVRVVPVQDPQSRCLLGVFVPAGDLGIHPSEHEQARVYFQFSQSANNFALELRQSSVVLGEHLATEKNAGILLARFNNISNNYEAALNTSLVAPDIGVSIIKVGLLLGGFDRSYAFYGQLSDPPLYPPAQFNFSLDVGHQYSVKRLRGYNPLFMFNNTLASSNCSEEPLLEETLSDVSVSDARTIFVAWTIRNVRKGLNFTFVLAVKECELLWVKAPCKSFRVDVSGKSHTLTNLKPYSNYSVKIETKRPPLRSTTWEMVHTPEAAPEGVNTPLIQILSPLGVNISWSIPERPNGVITSYSLYMNNGTGYYVECQGVKRACHVTGLIADQTYRFYVVANTSAGGRRSEEVTVRTPAPERASDSPETETAFPLAAIVGIALSGAFVILLFVVLFLKVNGYREMRKLEKYQKAYHFMDMYNYVDVSGRENVQLRAKMPVKLQKAPHLKGTTYEIQELSADGLQNTWTSHHANQGFNDDKWQDVLPDADYHRFDRPGSDVTSQHYDEILTPRVMTQTATVVPSSQKLGTQGSDDSSSQSDDEDTLAMTKNALDTGDDGQKRPRCEENTLILHRAPIGTQIEREHFDEVENILHQVTKL